MVDLEAWERAKPHLQAALDASGNTHSLDDVLEGVYSGEFQFWHSPDAYCVTQICEHPLKKVLHFWLAGGNVKSLMKVIEPVVCEWALKERGCDEAESGLKFRRGWDRLVPAGYTEYARSFRKALS
jgi:hypothetical protein